MHAQQTLQKGIRLKSLEGKKEQLIIINEFNRIIEHYRGKYNSLFLTNFRNSTKLYSRKRISFNVAYKLISYIIKKIQVY